jgi:hypothetical protein
MNTLAQRLCIHATAPFVALVGGAFAVAKWIPPFKPGGSFEQLAAHLQGHSEVRVAAAMFFFGGAFFVFPAAAIAAQLRRIEGPRSVMAQAQMLSAAVGVLFILIPAALWLAITYYHGTDPGQIATINAACWFMILGAVAPAVLQNAAIAVAVLSSDGRVYPRWVGYVNLYCAVGLLVGVLIPFFHHGPFAWNGVVGFWLVATDFFFWVTVMWVCTARAITEEANRKERTSDERLHVPV